MGRLMTNFFLCFPFSCVWLTMTAEYPFINYGVVNRQQNNADEWQQTARLSALERFSPENLRYFSDHLVDVYEEAASIARPPLLPSCRKPLTTTTGYIICVYKVFDGDDGERFERNWLYWTGNNCLVIAVRLCVRLPPSSGLVNISGSSVPAVVRVAGHGPIDLRLAWSPWS